MYISWAKNSPFAGDDKLTKIRYLLQSSCPEKTHRNASAKKELQNILPYFMPKVKAHGNFCGKKTEQTMRNTRLMIYLLRFISLYLFGKPWNYNICFIIYYKSMLKIHAMPFAFSGALSPSEIVTPTRFWHWSLKIIIPNSYQGLSEVWSPSPVQDDDKYAVVICEV